MNDPQRRTPRRWLLAHLALVCGLAVLVVVLVSTTPEDAGANIGAGLVGLPLLLLGLPWSLPFLINPYRFDAWSVTASFVVSLGPAFLNVLLHGLSAAVRRVARRDEWPAANR